MAMGLLPVCGDCTVSFARILRDHGAASGSKVTPERCSRVLMVIVVAPSNAAALKTAGVTSKNQALEQGSGY